jgi:hypothetical protein
LRLGRGFVVRQQDLHAGRFGRSMLDPSPVEADQQGIAVECPDAPGAAFGPG